MINLKSLVWLLMVLLILFFFFSTIIFSFIHVDLNCTYACRVLSDLDRVICLIIDLIKLFAWFMYQSDIKVRFQVLNLCELLCIFGLKSQDPSLPVLLFIWLNQVAIPCSHIFSILTTSWLQEFRRPCKSGFRMALYKGMSWGDLIHGCRPYRNSCDPVHIFWEI